MRQRLLTPRCKPTLLAMLISAGCLPVMAATPSTSSAAPRDAALDASQSGQTMTVTAPADEDFTPGGDQPVRAYLEGQVAHVGRLGMLGEQKAMDVPFNVIGFTAKMIQDQQAKTIADVVRNDAGVQNVKGYSNFVKSYRIRGFLLKPWQSISLYANHTEALQPGSVAPRNDSVTNLGAITGIAHSKQNEVGGRVILAGSAARCRCLKLKKTSRMIGADGAYGMNGEQRHREIETNVFGEPVLGFLLNASATQLDPVMEKTAGGTYDGNQAVGVPRDNYTLGAEYDIRPLEGLTATALITHTGSQSLDDAHFTIVVLAVTSVTLIIFVLIITLWMS